MGLHAVEYCQDHSAGRSVRGRNAAPAIFVIDLAAGWNMGVFLRERIAKHFHTSLRVERDPLQNRMARVENFHVFARGTAFIRISARIPIRIHVNRARIIPIRLVPARNTNGIPVIMGEHTDVADRNNPGAIYMYSNGNTSTDPNESGPASKYMKVLNPSHPILQRSEEHRS